MMQKRGVLVLLSVALLAWGVVFWRNTQDAPVRQRIDTGITYLNNGQIAAAESQWQEATRLAPQNTQAWELLGDLYLTTKDYKAAQNAFTHAAETNSSNAGIEVKAASSALQAQDLKTARRFSEAVLSEDANNVQALETLIAVEKGENHPDARFKLLQRLVKLQPENGSTLLALATELALREDFKELLPIAQKLVIVEPNATTSYFLRGLAYFNMGPSAQADAQAEADFLKAGELEAIDGESHRFLARLYTRQNHPLKAIEQYKEIVRARPHAMSHLYELAQAQRLAGETRESQQTQALFSHLKEINRQIFDLHDRADLFPKDPAPAFQLAKLLLSCVVGSEAEFQLFRFRYLNGQMPSVGEYVDRTMKLAPPNSAARQIGPQVESIYTSYLQKASEKLQGRDFAGANREMARAMLIRPQDARTLQALEGFKGSNPLGTAPPISPNSAFFD